MNGTKIPWANHQNQKPPPNKQTIPLTRPQTSEQDMPLLLLVVPEWPNFATVTPYLRRSYSCLLPCPMRSHEPSMSHQFMAHQNELDPDHSLHERKGVSE